MVVFLKRQSVWCDVIVFASDALHEEDCAAHFEDGRCGGFVWWRPDVGLRRGGAAPVNCVAAPEANHLAQQACVPRRESIFLLIRQCPASTQPHRIQRGNSLVLSMSDGTATVSCKPNHRADKLQSAIPIDGLATNTQRFTIQKSGTSPVSLSKPTSR